MQRLRQEDLKFQASLGYHSEFKQREHRLHIEILSQNKIQTVKPLKVSTWHKVRLRINAQYPKKLNKKQEAHNSEQHNSDGSGHRHHGHGEIEGHGLF